MLQNSLKKIIPIQVLFFFLFSFFFSLLAKLEWASSFKKKENSQFPLLQYNKMEKKKKNPLLHYKQDTTLNK